MKKYRRIVKRDDQRNYEIFPAEAIEWDGTNYHQLTDFLDARSSRWDLKRLDGPVGPFAELVLRIPGKTMLIYKGNMVVRNAHGDIDQMDPTLFNNLYEEVNE